jgi:Domain of unknown function (DUF4267)
LRSFSSAAGFCWSHQQQPRLTAYRLAPNRICERIYPLKAFGLFAAILIAHGSAHVIGWFMLAATLIPIADGVIVLHQGSSRTVAFGVHGGTAVAMLIISGLLLIN